MCARKPGYPRPTLMGPSPDSEHAAALRDVVAGFDHARVGEEIGHNAHDGIPTLRTQNDPEALEETIVAATSNVVAILDGMLNGVDSRTITAPRVSLQWAELLVQRGVDLSAVPWSYSYGQSRMAEALRDVVVSLDVPASEKWELGDGLTRYVTGYVESVCSQMVDHFSAVQARWRTGPGAAQREVIDGLLMGRFDNQAAASDALGYDLEGTHVAAIVWVDPHDPDRPAGSVLTDTAKRLLGDLGATRTVAVTNGATAAWAWGTGPAIDDGMGRSLSITPSLSAALGAAGGGMDGFVRSHRDAVEARRMASLLNRRSGSVVRYRAVALTSLIATDAAQAARFVEEELGPLAEDSDAMRRLRATLAAYFEESMRPVRTARRLGVHQNTIAYRIQQAEQAIGRPLNERRLELEAALRLAEARDALRSMSR